MSETLATNGVLRTHRHPKSYYQRLEARQTEGMVQRPLSGWLGQAAIYLHGLASEQVQRHRAFRHHAPEHPAVTATQSLDFIYPQLQELGIPVRLVEPVSVATPELGEAA